MNDNLVYLDNNATTRVAPEVVEAMLPYLGEKYGNPSSPYSFARSAALAVDDARKRVAGLVGAESSQIFFTSGGTESNAMAILGSLPAQKPRNEIIISAVEHASVWAWQGRLKEMGFLVHVAPVDSGGALDLGIFEGLLSERTALVSVMLANNETGVMYPLIRIAELAHQAGALVHSDTVQAVGKVPLNLNDMGVDFASSSSHKHHGIKGIGIIYIRNALGFYPVTLGGEQESGIRPGTEPVHQIAGLGKAAELAGEWLSSDGEKPMRDLRDSFESWLINSIEGVVVAGASGQRIPNTTLAVIDGVETEPILALLDMEGISCSSGSACSSGAHEASHVLKAMGMDKDAKGNTRGVLRVSSSRYTTDADYARLKEVLPGIVKRLRQ